MSAEAAAPPDGRPTDAGGATCGSYPRIVSYHVHGGWDATNASLSRLAYTTFASFAVALGALPGICPFSHANASAHFESVCSFPFDWSSVADPTNASSGLFGSMNHAYFVPRSKFLEAMDWWRQHHGPLHYMMHANTGCEYLDHSDWSMKSNNYPEYKQSLEGLWCCKQGPPGCSCDMVIYRLSRPSSDPGQQCLTAAPAPGRSLGLAPCVDLVASWGSTRVWRETQYVYPPTVGEADAFRQVEEFNGGSGSGGGSSDGGGRCIGASACEVGATVGLERCAVGRRATVSWVGERQTDPLGSVGALRCDTCYGPPLCVVPLQRQETIVLAPCNASANVWRRIFLD